MRAIWGHLKEQRKVKPPRTKKLTEAIKSRVTPHEKEFLAAVAQDSGASLSQWLRKVSLQAAGAIPEVQKLLDQKGIKL